MGLLTSDSLKELGIEPPYNRKYPGDEKRQVSLTIGTYMGYATHFHLNVREDDNPVWDENKERWVSSREDEEGRGIRFYTKFNEEKEIKEWVWKIFPKWFSLNTHYFYARGAGDVDWIEENWEDKDVYCDVCDSLLKGFPDNDVDSNFYLGRQGGIYCGFEHYREEI